MCELRVKLRRHSAVVSVYLGPCARGDTMLLLLSLLPGLISAQGASLLASRLQGFSPAGFRKVN